MLFQRQPGHSIQNPGIGQSWARHGQFLEVESGGRPSVPQNGCKTPTGIPKQCPTFEPQRYSPRDRSFLFGLMLSWTAFDRESARSCAVLLACLGLVPAWSLNSRGTGAKSTLEGCNWFGLQDLVLNTSRIENAVVLPGGKLSQAKADSLLKLLVFETLELEFSSPNLEGLESLASESRVRISSLFHDHGGRMPLGACVPCGKLWLNLLTAFQPSDGT